MSSVKKNFGYNLVLTLCGYIFPLITYPYISRVLGVQNIGVCNFVDSVINYFILFSYLGIGSFGVREIARESQNNEKRDYVFSNLLTINLITSFIAICLLTISIFTIPKFADYKPFLLIGIAKLFFNVFLVEWFFQGIQNFKYITTRSLIVKTIYVVTVFIFINGPEDVLLYFFLTVFSTIINAIINWLYAKQLVNLSFRNLNIQLFFPPVITFGYYRILTSMYTTFNTVFLGFTSGDIEVGYFTTATKLYSIIMGVFTAFTTVMVPKVSELIHNSDKEKIQWISNQTMSVLTIVSIPIIVFSLFCAPNIIYLIAGPGYEGAITPFRIVIFLLLIIGSEQILIQQFLMASTKNKPILIISTIGAITGISLNILLTPKMGSVGSSIAWGCSELVVLFIGSYFVKQILDISIQYDRLFIDILWGLLYLLPLFIISLLNLNIWLNLIFSGLAVISVFLVINIIFNKNSLVVGIFNNLCEILNVRVKKG